MRSRHWALSALLLTAVAAGCSKPSADELFAKGNTYVEQNMIPEAIVQYKMAVQADPKRADIRVKLSEAYLRHRDGSGALREAIAAADLLPNDITAQIRAGNLLLLASSFDDAKARGEKALAIDGKNAEALVLVGNAQAGLQKLDDAIVNYQEAIILNPSGDQAYVNLGIIQNARGQQKEAEATFRKAVEAAPKAVSTHLALASFLWSAGRLPEAEEVLKNAQALDPAGLPANRALGAFYMATSRPALAEPYFKAVAAAANTDTAQLALADYYLVVRRVDDAKAILTPLTQKTDMFGPASLRLAALEAAQNNRTAAAAIVRSVVDKTPKYAPARLLQIRLQVLDGKLDDALAGATALIKDEANTPAAAEAWFITGGIEASRDRFDDALKAYEESLRVQPRSAGVSFALAQLHLQLGNPDKAEMFARQTLEARPGDPGARSVLVRADLMRNDLTGAATELASLEKEFPNTAPVIALIAAREMTSGRPDAARTAYTKVATMTPNSLEALEGLVVLDLQAGKKAQALERVNDGLARIPPSASLYVIAARAFATAGETGKAEEYLKKAIDREPSKLAAYNLLGQLYVSQKRLPDAKEQFQALLARNPRSIPANTMLGMVLEAQGDIKAAEQQYQKTLGVDPNAAVAANNLAWIMVSTNQSLDQALQLGETALKTLPEEPHVNDTVGWIYLKKKMPERAATRLEISVRRDQSDPAVFYHLGLAYLDMGEKAKGEKALEKALSMGKPFDGIEDARKALAGSKR